MISAEWWSLKSKCNELNKEWVGVKELEMKTRILAMKYGRLAIQMLLLISVSPNHLLLLLEKTVTDFLLGFAEDAIEW